jgi:hypothetical protein
LVLDADEEADLPLAKVFPSREAGDCLVERVNRSIFERVDVLLRIAAKELRPRSPSTGAAFAIHPFPSMAAMM